MNLNGRLSFTGNVSGSMGAQLVADVEANPAGSPSQTLVSIRVGDVIYSIPSGGGGGGTSDYNALNNKPKVNNVTLSGDLTLADLGIQPAISFPGDGSKYLDGNGSFSTPGGLTKEVLYNDPSGTVAGNITISNDINNYSFIGVLTECTTVPGYKSFNYIDTEELTDNIMVVITSPELNAGCTISVLSNTVLRFSNWTGLQPTKIYKIIGYR